MTWTTPAALYSDSAVSLLLRRELAPLLFRDDETTKCGASVQYSSPSEGEECRSRTGSAEKRALDPQAQALCEFAAAATILQRALVEVDHESDSSALSAPCDMEATRREVEATRGLRGPQLPSQSPSHETDEEHDSEKHGVHFAALTEQMEDEMKNLRLEAERLQVMSSSIHISAGSGKADALGLSQCLGGLARRHAPEAEQSHSEQDEHSASTARAPQHVALEEPVPDTPRTSQLRALLEKTTAMSQSHSSSESIWRGIAARTCADSDDGLSFGGIETFEDLQRALAFELVSCLAAAPCCPLLPPAASLLPAAAPPKRRPGPSVMLCCPSDRPPGVNLQYAPGC
jgi:hypothetical protein